jgi:hypothetical protein
MDRLSATFIVRLSPTGKGGWTAVVERVKTGEKFRVRDIDSIGTLIASVVADMDGKKAGPN